MQNSGVIARGIVTPIFKTGDDLLTKISDSVIENAKTGNYTLSSGDIVAVTEAVVGRAQGNYAGIEHISKDVRSKFGGGTLGIVFPILSRNRFENLLAGIAGGCEKLIIQLSYPSDEVGNKLLDISVCDEHGVNPYSDSFTEKQFREVFGMETVHEFTGVDYIELYKKIAKNCEIVLSNDPKYILNYTKNILCCDIHSRRRTQNLLIKAGADICLCLDDLLTSSVDGSGFSEYGLLGSNKASETTLKLFPRDSKEFVKNLQKRLFERTGLHFEVMIYGDGCFKDPVCGIWELADPVVSPAYTDGLAGTPNEIKIKFIADSELSNLSGEDLNEGIRNKIRSKESSLVGDDSATGTTPRRIFDLVGSLCDLITGSGDRGTPVVLVQNYFKNYASE